MTIPLEDLLVKAQNAFDAFRVGYHAQVAASEHGGPGSTAYPGAHSLLTLRSRTGKGGTLVALATELLNGSGELPDSNALRSHAVSLDVEPVVYIATLCSLMVLMDVTHSIADGDGVTVSRVFDLMTVGGEPPTTWESMCSKRPSTLDPTPSPEPALGVTDGQMDRSAPS